MDKKRNWRVIMNLYEVLNKLEINYEEISHEKVMTVEESILNK